MPLEVETKKSLAVESAGLDAAPAKSISLIDEAKATADRIEKANENMKELLRKQEEMFARHILGGRSLIVEPVKEETEDEKWARESAERYKGTGLNPAKR